jgi:hypothetical protein
MIKPFLSRLCSQIEAFPNENEKDLLKLLQISREKDNSNGKSDDFVSSKNDISSSSSDTFSLLKGTLLSQIKQPQQPSSRVDSTGSQGISKSAVVDSINTLNWGNLVDLLFSTLSHSDRSMWQNLALRYWAGYASNPPEFETLLRSARNATSLAKDASASMERNAGILKNSLSIPPVGLPEMQHVLLSTASTADAVTTVGNASLDIPDPHSIPPVFPSRPWTVLPPLTQTPGTSSALSQSGGITAPRVVQFGQYAGSPEWLILHLAREKVRLMEQERQKRDQQQSYVDISKDTSISSTTHQDEQQQQHQHQQQQQSLQQHQTLGSKKASNTNKAKTVSLKRPRQGEEIPLKTGPPAPVDLPFIINSPSHDAFVATDHPAFSSSKVDESTGITSKKDTFIENAADSAAVPMIAPVLISATSNLEPQGPERDDERWGSVRLEDLPRVPMSPFEARLVAYANGWLMDAKSASETAGFASIDFNSSSTSASASSSPSQSSFEIAFASSATTKAFAKSIHMIFLDNALPLFAPSDFVFFGFEVHVGEKTKKTKKNRVQEVDQALSNVTSALYSARRRLCIIIRTEMTRRKLKESRVMSRVKRIDGLFISLIKDAVWLMDEFSKEVHENDHTSDLGFLDVVDQNEETSSSSIDTKGLLSSHLFEAINSNGIDDCEESKGKGKVNVHEEDDDEKSRKVGGGELADRATLIRWADEQDHHDVKAQLPSVVSSLRPIRSTRLGGSGRKDLHEQNGRKDQHEHPTSTFSTALAKSHFAFIGTQGWVDMYNVAESRLKDEQEELKREEEKGGSVISTTRSKGDEKQCCSSALLESFSLLSSFKAQAELGQGRLHVQQRVELRGIEPRKALNGLSRLVNNGHLEQQHRRGRKGRNIVSSGGGDGVWWLASSTKELLASALPASASSVVKEATGGRATNTKQLTSKSVKRRDNSHIPSGGGGGKEGSSRNTRDEDEDEEDIDDDEDDDDKRDAAKSTIPMTTDEAGIEIGTIWNKYNKLLVLLNTPKPLLSSWKEDEKNSSSSLSEGPDGSLAEAPAPAAPATAPAPAPEEEMKAAAESSMSPSTPFPLLLNPYISRHTRDRITTLSSSTSSTTTTTSSSSLINGSEDPPLASSPGSKKSFLTGLVSLGPLHSFPEGTTLDVLHSALMKDLVTRMEGSEESARKLIDRVHLLSGLPPSGGWWPIEEKEDEEVADSITSSSISFLSSSSLSSSSSSSTNLLPSTTSATDKMFQAKPGFRLRSQTTLDGLCLRPFCNNPARLKSKFCSHQCGKMIAVARLVASVEMCLKWGKE